MKTKCIIERWNSTLLIKKVTWYTKFKFKKYTVKSNFLKMKFLGPNIKVVLYIYVYDRWMAQLTSEHKYCSSILFVSPPITFPFHMPNELILISRTRYIAGYIKIKSLAIWTYKKKINYMYVRTIYELYLTRY